jgi:hypothetical protein
LKLLLSLDYELFFGRPTGSVEACLLRPTEMLATVARRLGLRFCLFVDAGYLLQLKRLGSRYPRLSKDYSAVAAQLESLSAEGNDVQLHVHPHWEDSSFDGEHWIIDARRYRLHDFPEAERIEIVKRYVEVLRDICGTDVFAFRAGGWCLQPFTALRAALRQAGVWLDSTVFAGGYNGDAARGFDFRSLDANAGSGGWRFDADPIRPTENGYFYEVPITAVTTGPSFYWRMALARIRRRPGQRAFGDGRPLEHERAYYLSRLLRPTTSPASLDGIKAGLLCGPPFEGAEFVNAMGHPKSLTASSFDSLRGLCESRRITSVTYRDFLPFAPPCGAPD